MAKSENRKSFGAWSPQGRIAHLKGPGTPCGLLIHLAAELTNSNRNDLEALINLGAVYVNKLRAMDSEYVVKPGDLLRVHLEPKRYFFDKATIRIVYEDANFTILSKPSGVPMHATLDNAIENLANSFHQKLYVTHRLDVPTSGLVLLAKNKDYQAVFNDLVARREVTKVYQSLTLKPLELGLKRHLMEVSERSPKKVYSVEEYAKITSTENQEVTKGQKFEGLKFDECLLEIISSRPVDFDLGRTIETRAPGYDNKIRLITGRTHQIRAQLSKLGAPLVGDEMYGGIKCGVFGLHACGLKFLDPLAKKEHSFEDIKRW